ncbi:MAG: hypothetical protein JWL73_2118 [Actinomycetia bacterium]|nr:hypothetical protein [Actinomycetes bacterium]
MKLLPRRRRSAAAEPDPHVEPSAQPERAALATASPEPHDDDILRGSISRPVSAFVEIARLCIVALTTAAGLWMARGLDATQQGGLAVMGCLVGYVFGGVLGRLLVRAVDVVEHRADRLPPAQLLAGLIGGAVGAVSSGFIAVTCVIVLPLTLGLSAAALAFWFCGYVGFRIFVHESEQLFGILGLSTSPLVQARTYDHADGFLVDTSAVMDGHLLPLARSGLLASDLMVPRFVLDELQGFADSPDAAKSRRAQRGLEVLDVIRREGPSRLYVLDDEVPEVREVDAKLVVLAKKLRVRVLTNDTNLARVAEVQGVPTANLRKLATDLGPEVNAGDVLAVVLNRVGREEGQGVGFLPDGSMVVVNGGAELVGRGEIRVSVASIVPTAVGRIVFAVPAPVPPPPEGGARLRAVREHPSGGRGTATA